MDDYQPQSNGADAGQEAKRATLEAADTVQTAAGDMADQARQSAEKVSGKVQQAGLKAVDAAHAYAKDAVESAGRKVDDVKSQWDTAKASATDYINEDPVRAVKIAAISGGLLTALVLGLSRRGR